MPPKPKRIQIAPGAIVRQYSDAQVAAFVAAWLDAYGKNSEGVKSDKFLWHIFSGNRYPSLTGNKALAEYMHQAASEYVVFSNSREVAIETDQLPEKCSFSDYFVCPRNLAWTMAFTHEDGWLGPYFAKHQDFARLEELNLGSLRKAKEAEAARLRGWS